MVFDSILCWTISSGMPSSSLCMSKKIHLWILLKAQSTSVTNSSSVEFTFTSCTFSLVPKLIFVKYSSSVTVQLAMVKFYICFQVSVSTMIISPTFGWKKVSNNYCLTISRNITRLTHTGSTSYFLTKFTILRFGIWISLETSSIWIGTSMVPLKNKFNSVTNITSSSSFDISEWKS